MKKIISLVLAAVMLLSMGCVTAFADGAKTTSGPWEEFSPMFGGASLTFASNDGTESKRILSYDYKSKELKLDNDAMPGATYDKSTNTLTIRDLDASDYALSAWFMGDDFKLRVEGNCSIGPVYAYNYFNSYSTSLNIIGTGKLTVNKKGLDNNAFRVYSYTLSPEDNGLMKLSIADSVTVDAYAHPEDGDKPEVISVAGTGLDTAAKAVTAGGKPIAGVKTEQQKVKKRDYINVAIPRSGKQYTYSYEAKSKTDPTGVYSASRQTDENDDLTGYYVRKYILVPGYDMYAEDSSYGEYGGKQFTVEEFNKEFTIVTAPQPKEIYVTSKWREKNVKGNTGVRIKKLDDPENVYFGSPSGIFEPYSYDNPQAYYIYRVVWDENEGMYVEDTSFKSVSIKTAQLAANGYEVVDETVEERKQFHIWVMPAPYIDDEENYTNWDSDYDMLRRASDPEGIYVRTGTYYTEGDNGEHLNPGISVNKVFYDAENDVYYTNIRSTDPEINFSIPDADMEAGTSEFTYITEPKVRHVEIRYLPADYTFERYAKKVVELRKADEPGAVYCYDTWTTTRGGEEIEEHTVYKLSYNDSDGHYYIGGSEEYEDDGEDMTLEEMEAAGFTVVTESAPVELVLDGRVNTYETTLYTDKNGKKYIVDGYPEKIYAVDESQSFKNGDETYYFVSEAEGVKREDISDNEREENIKAWTHTLEAAEYHFKGTGTAPSGAKVSGSITSYLSNTDEITVSLLKGDDHPFPEVRVKGNSAEYSFDNVPDGEYVLHVEKANHVSRDYAVSVKGTDVTQDVKLCPKGDVNGDGETDIMDCSLAQRYIRELTDLDPYQIACGDVSGTGDGELDIQDVSRILRHIRELAMLY